MNPVPSSTPAVASPALPSDAQLRWAWDLLQALRGEIGQALIGQQVVVDQALGVATATSLLTMAYMTTMVQRVFWGGPRTPGPALAEVREVPASMRWAMGLLALAVLALGLFPRWLDPALALVSGM